MDANLGQAALASVFLHLKSMTWSLNLNTSLFHHYCYLIMPWMQSLTAITLSVWEFGAYCSDSGDGASSDIQIITCLHLSVSWQSVSVDWGGAHECFTHCSELTKDIFSTGLSLSQRRRKFLTVGDKSALGCKLPNAKFTRCLTHPDLNQTVFTKSELPTTSGPDYLNIVRSSCASSTRDK